MNLDQIRALVGMPSPWSKNDIQRLNSQIAALSRFISTTSNRYHNFFKVLKGRNTFEWTYGCETTL